MIDFGPVERMLRPLRAADGAEREGSRGWIEGVKRRLGLVTLEDDAAARLRQWEHDHLTADDLPAAPMRDYLHVAWPEPRPAWPSSGYMDGGLAAASPASTNERDRRVFTERLGTEDPEPEVLYECDCCERPNVPEKLKGIGYLCDDCLTSWTWDYGRYPGEDEPANHHAGRTCPFKIPA